MGIFLLLLFFSPVHGIFEGTCPRKDPPPGVLVVSTGSKLVLTCSGHVKVDGVKVSLTGSSSNITKRESSSDVTPATQTEMHNSAVSVKSDNNYTTNAVSEGYTPNFTEAGVTAAPGENRNLIYTDTGYTASPHTVQPTRATSSLKDESDWVTEEVDVDGDYEDEEGEGESRVTRGIKLRPEWKWNKTTVGKGDRDWGGITFGRSGATLSLASVRLTDSGKYTCHHRGKEKFGVKVVVTDPPESPRLFCYKKSPSSKIRCEGTPQKPIIKHPNCYLLLNKGSKEKFSQVQCSYSSRNSRCWCALDYIEDERRTVYTAFLCVTSITGNATSTLLYFTPLDIIKPDPPSNVSVQQKEGREKMLKVSWNLPTSWKQQDYFYKLIYEMKYKPVKHSFGNEQVMKIEGRRSETITDIMPGVDYLIQVRTKDEFDGLWSDWSPPVCARSWRKKPHPPSIVSVVEEEGQETMMVTWNLPTNLKEQHNSSKFIYEIKYWPAEPFVYNEEVRLIEAEHSYTIIDAMPSIDYLIQLRFKEEHDGQWSDWSTTFHARSLHVPDDLTTTVPEIEGSAYTNDNDNGTKIPPKRDEWVHHALWISGLFAVLSVILGVYIFRHRDRFMSKLHNLHFITLCGDSSQPLPSTPTAPEGVALVTVVPAKSNKECPPSDEKESEENEEQETLRERTETMHFNNTSYFFLQRE